MGKKMKEDIVLPLLVLKEIVLMPGTTVQLLVEKDNSIHAVNSAMENNIDIFVIMAKKRFEGDEVSLDCLYSVGTIATVRQILKLPNGQTRILLAGKDRAYINDVVNGEQYNCAQVEVIEQVSELSQTEQTARIRIVRDLLKQCEKRNMITNKVMAATLGKIRNLELLVDCTAEALSLPSTSRQTILEETDIEVRVESLISIIMNEMEIYNIREEIGEKLKDCVNQNQREYVLREQMKLIRKELGEENAEDELRCGI